MGGIGVSSAVVSFNVALYYNTIIAWCLFYFVQVTHYAISHFHCVLKSIKIIFFFKSFQSQLPWAECPNRYFQNGSYAPELECLVSITRFYRRNHRFLRSLWV